MIRRLKSFLFGPPPVKFQRARMVMVDLETFDLEPTSAFYAIGARAFTLGKDVGETTIDPDTHNTWCDELSLSEPDFLCYIHPDQMLSDPRFTSSEETIRWTFEKNAIEYYRARKWGVDTNTALDRFNRWLQAKSVEYVCSNSPNFDHAILRHAYSVTGNENPVSNFRSDFDVRTVGHLRHLMGMYRYAKRGTSRLHSPLDDCTLQIKAINEFIHAVESRKW